MLKGGDQLASLKMQLQSVTEVKQLRTVGEKAIAVEDFEKASKSFASVVAGGVTADAQLRLLWARSLAGQREYVAAAKEAQQAIAIDPDLLSAYMLRAEALFNMGQVEKAVRLLREALQRDPDNEVAQQHLKKLRRLVQDLHGLKEGVKTAIDKRRFEEAAALCAEGLTLNPEDKQLQAHFYSSRAKANSMIARSRAQGITREQREAASGGASENVMLKLMMSNTVPAEDATNPRAGVAACWRRCLQDANSAISADQTLQQPYLLKAQALQEMERWAEAEGTLQQCFANVHGARHDQSVLQKLAEAQFLIRKANRPDIYAKLGVGSKASEKEIRAAYKKAALQYHPDRFGDANDAAKKEAEGKFKELGEALSILTDEFTRKLWDEGHDLESIGQRVQMKRSNGR